MSACCKDQQCQGSHEFDFKMFFATAFGLVGPRACEECEKFYNRKARQITNRVLLSLGLVFNAGVWFNWWGFELTEKFMPVTAAFTIMFCLFVIAAFLFSRQTDHYG